MKLHKIWIEQCEAAKDFEVHFGTDKTLAYLIGEKFLNFLEAAEDDAEFRGEIPAFVASVNPSSFNLSKVATVSAGPAIW